jgi:hypothetical protein
MTGILTAYASTALSPEWDRWFDEAFTDLVTGDQELVRAEFDALIAACWSSPPPPDLPGRGEQSPWPGRPGSFDTARPGLMRAVGRVGWRFTGGGTSRSPPRQPGVRQHPRQ